jgi:hypothetical protein
MVDGSIIALTADPTALPKTVALISKTVAFFSKIIKSVVAQWNGTGNDSTRRS